MSKKSNTTGSRQNQLIPIGKSSISDEEINTVNAADLHSFLGIKTPLKDWITRKIREYGFIIDVDFCAVLRKRPNTRPIKEYHITIEMAKELSMVTKNKKGKEARQYFLSCEKKVKQIESNIPQNFAEALQLAADQAKQLELQAPLVEFAETVEGSEDCVTIGEYAKINGNIGRNKLFALLRDHKILMSNNTPYQKYINQGLFEVTEKSTSAGLKTVTLVTGKGQINLDKKLRKWI